MHEGSEQKALHEALYRLRQEHRDLDSAIEALGQSRFGDQLQLTRLKRRKLAIKDEIARIEDELLPDIIA